MNTIFDHLRATCDTRSAATYHAPICIFVSCRVRHHIVHRVCVFSDILSNILKHIHKAARHTSAFVAIDHRIVVNSEPYCTRSRLLYLMLSLSRPYATVCVCGGCWMVCIDVANAFNQFIYFHRHATHIIHVNIVIVIYVFMIALN